MEQSKQVCLQKLKCFHEVGNLIQRREKEHAMKTLAAALAASFLCLMPVATPASEIRAAKDCGDWIKERESKDKTTHQTWMLGYLSGLAVGSKRDFLKGTSNDAISLWVDNYCKANPLKNLGIAGAELARELIRQKSPKRSEPEARQQPL